MVWFLSEAAFSAGSKSAAVLWMNFNWQNWSVRWCGSWTLRQSDTMIRTQAERNLHLSLSLLQNTVPNHSFQPRLLTTRSVAVHNSVSIDLSTFLYKVQSSMPIFPHIMPSRYLHAAWPFPNGRRCKINDQRSGDHVQGCVSKLTVTAAQEMQRTPLRKTESEDGTHAHRPLWDKNTAFHLIPTHWLGSHETLKPHLKWIWLSELLLNRTKHLEVLCKWILHQRWQHYVFVQWSPYKDEPANAITNMHVLMRHVWIDVHIQGCYLIGLTATCFTERGKLCYVEVELGQCQSIQYRKN